MRAGPLTAMTLGTALALAAAVVQGCFDESTLENAFCEHDDHCWTNQHCVRTPTQLHGGLPGYCRPEGSDCDPGMQPGCECELYSDGVTRICSGSGLWVANGIDGACLCCPMTDCAMNQYPAVTVDRVCVCCPACPSTQELPIMDEDGNCSCPSDGNTGGSTT